MHAYSLAPLYFPAVATQSVIEVPVPLGLFVQQLIISSNESFSATVYRRNLTMPTAAFAEVTDHEGFACLRFIRPHRFAPGDRVDITASGGSPPYDGYTQVLYCLDEYRLVLGLDYVSDSSGTLALVCLAETITENAAGNMRVQFAKRPQAPYSHMLCEGMKVTLSPSPLSGTAVVTAVNDDNSIDLGDAYNASLDYGLLKNSIILSPAVPTELKPAFELFPTTASTSKVVRLTDSYGRAVGLNSQRRAFSDKGCLYIYQEVTGQPSANYYVSVAGQLAGV